MIISDKFKLNSKKAFVIGGSGLIGSEVCKLLSDFGAKVFNLDLKNKKTSRKKIIYLNFNIKKLESIEKKMKFFFKKHGCPDVFVNCSYPVSKDWKRASFSKVTQKTISENVNLHLNSYIWAARVAAEEMKKRKIKGSIIQFGSIYGVVGQNLEIYKGTNMEENMIYASIKGGIVNNVRQMCSYYGKFGIRVNSISPGGVLGHIKGKKISQDKIFISNYKKINPLKRLANADEISPAVVFLASDASSYITGVNLMIDGGWTAI